MHGVISNYIIGHGSGIVALTICSEVFTIPNFTADGAHIVEEKRCYDYHKPHKVSYE